MRWDPADEDARTFFAAELRADPQARGWWAWVATHDGVEVGNAGFGGRPGENHRLTIGYAVHPEFRGRGYATEILETLTAWALAQPDVDVVRATIRPDNEPSLRVAAKAGYEHTGETVEDDEHGTLLVFLHR